MNRQSRWYINHALRGVQTGLQGSIEDYRSEPSETLLQTIYATAIGYLGLRFSLINKGVTHLDRIPAAQVKAVKGIAVFVGQRLNEQISQSHILDGFQRATEVQLAKVKADLEKSADTDEKFTNLQAIGMAIQLLQKPVEAKKRPDAEETIPTRSEDKKEKKHPHIKLARLFFITDPDNGVVRATLNGQVMDLEPPDLEVLELLAKQKVEGGSPVQITEEVSSAIRRIMDKTGLVISSGKTEGSSEKSPAYELKTRIELVQKTREEAITEEREREKSKKQALILLMDNIDDVTPEIIEEVLTKIPNTRQGGRNKSHKIPPQAVVYGFAALINRLANPHTDTRKFDDLDKEIMEKILGYMENNREIENLNGLITLIAQKFGMEKSGYLIRGNFGKYTLDELKKSYADVETDSLQRDEALLEKYHLYRGKLRRVLTRVVNLFPIKGNSIEEALKTQKFKLINILTKKNKIKSDLDFIQNLINSGVFHTRTRKNKITVESQLTRAEIACFFFLRMNQKDANVMELPDDVQKALLRVIEHDLPEVILEIKQIDPQGLRPALKH